MKLVFVCSPYRGDVEINTLRAKRYCRFVYTEGAVPFAPHLHNPQFLNDFIPEEREIGINMGVEVLKRCDELWLFGDLLTEGMELELVYAIKNNIAVRYFTDKCEEVFEAMR